MTVDQFNPSSDYFKLPRKPINSRIDADLFWIMDQYLKANNRTKREYLETLIRNDLQQKGLIDNER